MLILSSIFLPYSVYCILGGLRIIRGEQNIVLFHYQFLFFLLRLIRGADYARARRTKFFNSSEYNCQGWYAFVGGVLLVIGFTFFIVSSLGQLLT
jgi:hypothetical protein